MNPIKRSQVTDAELAVLKTLWDDGPSTIRALADVLYPRGSASDYSTVQKLLERLEEKRCVRRRKSGRSNVYTATVDRDALIARRLEETAEKLCEGSMTPLLTHLVGSSRLGEDDLAALRKLVRDHDSRRRKE